jgi:hypothetical protein
LKTEAQNVAKERTGCCHPLPKDRGRDKGTGTEEVPQNVSFQPPKSENYVNLYYSNNLNGCFLKFFLKIIF